MTSLNSPPPRVRARRTPSIDLLRIVVVVLVVYRHTYPAGDDQLLLVSVSVPFFFFFLTGWLWRPGRRSFKGEIANRWGTLGIPYVVWLFALYIGWAPLTVASDGGKLGTLLGPLVGGVYASRPFTTFWFLVALFLMAVTMRLLDKLPIWGTAVVAVLCLLVGGLLGEQLALLPLGIGMAVPALGFGLAAFVLRSLVPSSSTRSVMVAAVLIPVLVLVSLPLEHIDMKYGQLGTPLLSPLVAIGLAWAAIVLLDRVFTSVRLGDRVGNSLAALTSVAVIPVLLHPAVLWAVDAPTTGAPLWVFLAAAILPWALALLVARTPAGPWLVGQRRS